MKVSILIITCLMTIKCLMAETNVLKLDIEKAIQIGLKNNYDILSAQVDLEMSRNNWLIAKKGKGFKTDLNLEYNITQEYDTRKGSVVALQQYLPTGGEIKLTTSLNQTELDPYFYGVPKNTTLSYGVQFSQPLLILNQYKLKRKKSYLQYQIARQNFIDMKRNFIINVITSFYSIVSLIENIKVSKHTYNSAKKLYQLSKQKFNKGITKDIDLLEAELQWTKKDVELKKLELQLKNSIEDFKNLLRINEEIELNYEINDINFPTNIEFIKRDKSGLINRNSEIIKKRYNLELKRLEIEEGKAGREIEIITSAEYEQYGEKNNLEQTLKEMDKQWVIKVQLQIPIFDWGINRKRVEIARLKKHKEYLSFLKEQDRLQNEIEKQLRSLYLIREEIKLDTKAREYADKDLKLKTQKYKEGLADVSDVIRAQDNYLEASYNLIKSKIDFILAKINLAYLIGEDIY